MGWPQIKLHLSLYQETVEHCESKESHVTQAVGRVQVKPDGTRWRTGGEVRGKLANGVGSHYSHATSEHGVSSITTADTHTSAASRRLNWRPRRFKWTRPFRRKAKSAFCACAITFQTQSTSERSASTDQTARHHTTDVTNIIHANVTISYLNLSLVNDAVRTATGLRTGPSGDRFPGRVRDFLLQNVHISSGTTQTCIQWEPGVFSVELKWTEPDYDHRRNLVNKNGGVGGGRGNISHRY